MSSTPIIPRLLTTEETAVLLHVAPKTLRNWSHLGKGPQCTRIGRKVRYAERDVAAFINAERARAIIERPVA
jgi:predicted site-specific integrase-resolvase